MEPNERENSSTYLSRPVESSTKNRSSLVLGVLLVLALVAAGVLGWLWYQEKATVATTKDQLAAAKQEANLLGSNTAKSVVSGTEAAEPKSASDRVVQAALAYALAATDTKSGEVEARIIKKDGDFAKVSITTKSTGYGQILKKSNDQWVVIVSGQAPPSEEVIKRYGIPADLLKA